MRCVNSVTYIMNTSPIGQENGILSASVAFRRRALMLLVILLAGGILDLAHAQSALGTKVVSRAEPARSNSAFGSSVAISDSYLVCGEPGTGFLTLGKVYVYKSTNRQYLRTLTAAGGAVGDRFGESVALSGKYVVVGASRADDDRGAAYIFDVTTGRQLRKLVATDGFDLDDFGTSVTVSGNLVVVGAPHQNRTVSPGFFMNDTGAAYAFDLLSGVQLGKWTASDGLPGDLFGTSVSASGSLAAIGAYGASSRAGAIYLFDTKTGTRLRKLVASDAAPSNSLGYSVSLSGNKILAGAPGSGLTGAVYLFDCQIGTHAPKIVPLGLTAAAGVGTSVSMSGTRALVGLPLIDSGRGAVALLDFQSGFQLPLVAISGESDDKIGMAVALSSTLGVAGAPGDDDRAASAGAAYLCDGAIFSKPLSLVAAKGTIAPGTTTAKFSTLSPPVVSGSGSVAYLSTLTVTGAGTGGVATGLWKETAGISTLIGRGGMTSDGESGSTMVSVAAPLFNDDSDVLFSTVEKTPGVRTNRPSILSRAMLPTEPTTLLLAGDTYSGLLGTALGKIDEVVQNIDYTGRAAAAIHLKSSGASVTAANDTAVIVVNGDGTGQTAFAEGSPSPVGLDTRYGQALPKVAIMQNYLIWGGGLLAGPATPPGTVSTSTNRALFRYNIGGSVGIVARAGQTASAGTTYNSFLAYTESYDNQPTFKTTLLGTGVTTANNESIFRFGLGQVWRKGDLLNAADYPGVKISRVIKFWALRHGQVIALTVLSGTGVTTANDQVLVLFNPYDRNYVLLREGDYTEGTDGAKIGTIQKVDVEPVGSQYVVLASLTGSTATNQALFTGRTLDFGPSPINPLLTRAGMKLRKGTAYGSSPVKITSMSITNTTDAAGAGAKGLGQAINDQGTVGLTIDFSNGIREIRKGVP